MGGKLAGGNPMRVLFVCTHNSARSQMAEALLREMGGDAVDSQSAGTHPGTVHPLAIRAMAEIGIDISGARTKSTDSLLNERFDYVITLCDDANESCPIFPNAAHRLHWSFPNPSEATGSEEERLAVFRSIREGIRERLASLLQEAEKESGS